jgi:hypothetical protein
MDGASSDQPSGNKSSGLPRGGRSSAEPELEAPLLERTRPQTATILFGAGMLLAAVASAAGIFETANGIMARNTNAAVPELLIAAADLPGFVAPIDREIANGSEHILAALVMPEPEKERLRHALKETSMRVGAVTVWDTVDEDGDRIKISSAGFTQKLVIKHAPARFFVPYLPGTSVHIEALQDGAGGGVTLGVTTSMGNVPLPHLAPGQVVEIAIP